MSILAKPPIAPDVANVIGDCAEHVENRSLLLDKFIFHKSWPPVYLETTRQPMKLDDASRWSFIRMAQNGDAFLERELASCQRQADGRNASEENREKARIKRDILRSFKRCACRALPGELGQQKLRQNREFAHALIKCHSHAFVIYGELQGRLIVNLSDSLVQNAGICLDRNTGLPYIPGSAVKGVARHVALSHLRSGDWSIEAFMKVFGSSEADFKQGGELHEFADSVSEEKRTMKGGVDFLAAHPITEPTIVVDISNVHYPEYYQTGEVGNLSKENPKPNTFPAVERGVRYAFCFAMNGIGAKSIDEELFDRAKSVLVEAVTIHGIGAKTGAGYGWFRDVTAEILEAQKRLEAEKAAKREKEEHEKAEAAKQAAAKAKAEELAKLTSCERTLLRWSQSPNIKAIVNGHDIAQFNARTDDEKKGIVEALRIPDGIGAKVWAIIKGVSPEDPKKKLSKPGAESAIRAHCKNVLKMGKMP